MSFMHVLKQAWETPLPYPSESFNGRTVIVTGANVGLGLEATRHFVRLGASKVILACRSLKKGEEARADIERSTGRKGICEVWEVDMADMNSVQSFAKRAERLERLDVVCENAGVAGIIYKPATQPGWENMTAVNVVGTFLLALNLLPILRKSGMKHNVVPRLVITSSGVEATAKFNEKNEPSIFDALNKNDPELLQDRYPTTKLLQVLGVRSLAEYMKNGAHAKQTVIVNCVNPGFCQSSLSRDATGFIKIMFFVMKTLFARRTEMGSRTIFAAAVAGEETNGQMMSSCVIDQPSEWVRSEEGKKIGDKAWKELMSVLEGLQPGVTANI